MTDVLSPEQRRYCMSKIQGKNTKPEIYIRSMVHTLGYRFRLHRKDLPGKPDIVFPRLRKIIFVHGCFWHMHKCRWGKVKPKTNSNFWEEKRTGNRIRDRKRVKELKDLGWDILIVWECELRKPDVLEKKVIEFLQ